jgi:predicted O-methyltransferase YrrM
VKVIVGRGVDTLPTLGPDGSFDLAFIDADKPSNLDYFLQAKRLVRKGGIIIVDNVVRQTTVSDLSQNEERIEGVRRLLRHLKDDRAVEAATIHTVGEKGLDGFLEAIVL